MTTTWQLTGITNGRGACDHCGRTLSRLFKVTSPDGVRMVVGKTCSKNLTGYNWQTAQAERIERIAQADAAAAAKWGDLYAALKVQAALAARRTETSGAAGEGIAALRDGYLSDDEARAFAEKCMAASIAHHGKA